MPGPREWPTKAEHTRQDVIALALDIQHYTERVQDAILSEDYAQAMTYNRLSHEAGVRQQELLKEARRQ